MGGVCQLLPGPVQEQQQGGEALGQDCVQRCDVMCYLQKRDTPGRAHWAVSMGFQQVEN